VSNAYGEEVAAVPFELPTSLVSLLSLFRPCFTQASFHTFCALCVGCLTRVRERTVTGMLTAAGLAGRWHHSRAHRFFSRARWSVDQLGLALLAVIVARLLDAEAPIRLVVDDTLLRRFGPKVFGRHLHYDNSQEGPPRARIAHGNAWVVMGIVVELAFMRRAICLPVLFRLWRPGAGPTQLGLAAELVRLVAAAYPQRALIVLVDGAYAGSALAPGQLPEEVTLIARARRDIRLYEPAPPRRAGQIGRPRLKGKPLATLRERAAAGVRWNRHELDAYGERRAVELISQRGLWYHAWGQAPAKAVAIRDRDATDQIEMVLITSDPDLPAATIVELYALRWSIEVAFRDAKQHGGVGDAENRTEPAVTRTAPFAFLCLTLAVVWYALAGHRPDELERRRRRSPWDREKRAPSVQDMLVKLRRTIILARLSQTLDADPKARKVAALAEAWELAAA
jgi:hypothetical protein